MVMAVRVHLLLLASIAGCATSTSRPIIGVLTVPVENGCVTAASGVSSSGDVTSCFHSLYVKWIEAAGARVVPLRYDAPLSELDALVGSLNGILFTGGETPIKTEPNSTCVTEPRSAVASARAREEATYASNPHTDPARLTPTTMVPQLHARRAPIAGTHCECVGERRVPSSLGYVHGPSNTLYPSRRRRKRAAE